MAEADTPRDPNVPPASENDAAPDEPSTGSDTGTDQAVDDIVRQEGDDELKAQDVAADQAVVMKLSPWERFKNSQREWWGSPRKKWSTIAASIAIIAALFAVPFTRYEVLGLFMREKVTVQVVDSKSGAPVSGAQIQLGGVRADTDAEGKAVVYVHAGRRQLHAGKKYYAGSTQTVTVTLSADHNVFRAKLVALGRQVKVKLVNKITDQPLVDAQITAGGANAKTDKDGLATLVLPSGASTQQASVTLGGYNAAKVTVDAGADLAKNTFAVTPSGKLYFLSNLSGTIDVVKTNLDGTDRQTVLAGTGNEDPNGTLLLPSHDWKYLALLSKRSGNNASLYLINTTDGDKLTTIDQSNATFNLIGWSGDTFVYQVTSNAISDWQPDQESLKSYDAATGQTLLLDQTQGSGTSQSDFVKQHFNDPYIVGDDIVYGKGWESSYEDASQIDGKTAELDSIGADGSDHEVLKTFALASGVQNYAGFGIQTEPYGPNELYIYFDDGTPNGQLFDYDNGTVSTNTTITDNDFFDNSSPTYLLSPSGNNTFWAEQQGGENTLSVGDENGGNQKQIANLSSYSPYGWYTDNYLLVSQDSELYIMPATGGTPLKITDYYNSPLGYTGYGGL